MAGLRQCLSALAGPPCVSSSLYGVQRRQPLSCHQFVLAPAPAGNLLLNFLHPCNLTHTFSPSWSPTHPPNDPCMIHISPKRPWNLAFNGWNGPPCLPISSSRLHLHSGIHFTPIPPAHQPSPEMQVAAETRAVLRPCLEPAVFQLLDFGSLLPFPETRAHTGRTIHGYLRLSICRSSDIWPCEQVRDSCIQSNTVSTTPAPRTKLET
ncbi:hypothetical protein BT67DRAFT_250437 [Trichocladium antarcticum]|uniref:Uncharacterized protein n=1 Tax=Trichocladium antarcticum TaxID=1450529 RepID=A0AAN6UBH3_9PEZI|nr:hypothetical protein BT67DRAFT_250437 [Trichocladium antarcticum]